MDAFFSLLLCIMSDSALSEFIYTNLVGLIKDRLNRETNRSIYTAQLQKSKFSDEDDGMFLLKVYERLYNKNMG